VKSDIDQVTIPLWWFHWQIRWCCYMSSAKLFPAVAQCCCLCIACLSTCVVKYFLCTHAAAGCPAEMYKWSASNDRCVPCPEGSSTPVRASAKCQCNNGYYRAARDKPSASCTRMFLDIKPTDTLL